MIGRSSDSPGLTAAQRKRLGVIFGGIGVVLLLTSLVTISVIRSDRRAAAESFATSPETCATTLKGLGGDVTELGGRIVYKRRGDLESSGIGMGELSVAAVLCPGWTMESACLGEMCPASIPFQMTLRPPSP